MSAGRPTWPSVGADSVVRFGDAPGVVVVRAATLLGTELAVIDAIAVAIQVPDSAAAIASSITVDVDSAVPVFGRAIGAARVVLGQQTSTVVVVDATTLVHGALVADRWELRLAVRVLHTATTVAGVAVIVLKVGTSPVLGRWLAARNILWIDLTRAQVAAAAAA